MMNHNEKVKDIMVIVKYTKVVERRCWNGIYIRFYTDLLRYLSGVANVNLKRIDNIAVVKICFEELNISNIIKLCDLFRIEYFIRLPENLEKKRDEIERNLRWIERKTGGICGIVKRMDEVGIYINGNKKDSLEAQKEIIKMLGEFSEEYLNKRYRESRIYGMLDLSRIEENSDLCDYRKINAEKDYGEKEKQWPMGVCKYLYLRLFYDEELEDCLSETNTYLFTRILNGVLMVVIRGKTEYSVEEAMKKVIIYTSDLFMVYGPQKQNLICSEIMCIKGLFEGFLEKNDGSKDMKSYGSLLNGMKIEENGNVGTNIGGLEDIILYVGKENIFEKCIVRNMNYKMILTVDQRLGGFISGKKCGKLTRIEMETGCNIELRKKTGWKDLVIFDSEGMGEGIIKMIKMVEMEFPVENSFFVEKKYHKKIIGQKGKNIQGIIKKYDVYLEFIDDTENKNNVLVISPRKNSGNIKILKKEIEEIVGKENGEKIEKTHSSRNEINERIIDYGFNHILSIEKSKKEGCSHNHTP